MKRYKVNNTGEVWTEDELRIEFENQKHDNRPYFDTFEDYMEYWIDRGLHGYWDSFTEVKRYVVWMTDANGATSPIDTIDAPEGYTATDYYWDCDANAPDEWIAMLDAAVEITLEEVEE